MCPKPSTPKMPEQPKPTPPPPPPEPTAVSPTIADGGGSDPEGAGRSAAQAQSTKSSKKRGVSALRIDLNVPDSTAPGQGRGLNIPQG